MRTDDSIGKYASLRSEPVGLDAILGIKPLGAASTVMPNKIGITSNLELIHYEAKVTALTIQIALTRLEHTKKWDLKHIRLAHQIIFSRIYDWAGKIRAVNIAKKDTFAPYKEIERRAQNILKRFHDTHSDKDGLATGLAKRSPKEIATALADLYNDLNLVHPFREGNGRAMKTICTAIARQAGYDFQWQNISKRKHLFDKACMSLERGPNSPLAILFGQIIQPYSRLEAQAVLPTKRQLRRMANHLRL